MISSKALCVFFLLYLSIDRSQNLRNISSSEKGTTRFDNVNFNVKEYERTIMAQLKSLNSQHEKSEEIYKKNDFNVKCEDITPGRRSSSSAKRMLGKIWSKWFQIQTAIFQAKRIRDTIKTQLISPNSQPVGM